MGNALQSAAIGFAVLTAGVISQTQSATAQIYYRPNSTATKTYRVYRPSYSAPARVDRPTTSGTVYRTSGSTYTRSSSRSQSSVKKSAPYRLDSGDIVAVIVQGVTGEFSKAPVHMPEKNRQDIIPSVGHPLVVLADGTLPLPLIDPVYVRGLTVTQARDRASAAYLDQQILNKANQVTMSLTRKRTISVNVFHDNPSTAMRGVSRVQLPADRANVLNALVGSGPYDRDAQVRVVRSSGTQSSSRQLRDGDIVRVQSPRTGYFYTGGILRGGEFELPNDRPINALQAISMAGGPKNQTLLGPLQVIVIRRNGGSVRASYAQVLNNPNGLQIQPGDTLVVR